MNCTAIVGEPVLWTGKRPVFMEALRESLERLQAQAPPQRWSN
jgi:hypothetical protein